MESTLTREFQFAAEDGTIYGKDKKVVAVVNPDGSEILSGSMPGDVTSNSKNISTEETLLLIKAKTDNLDASISTLLKPADTLAKVTTVDTVTNVTTVDTVTDVTTVAAVTNVATVDTITNDVKVHGSIAADEVESGNPIAIGGLAVDAAPTNVGLLDRVRAIFTRAGEQIIAGYDYSLNLLKVSVQNPLWSRYTDAENLVTASDIGAVDDTWKDQGSEIDCRGYKYLNLYINFSANDSTGNQLQVLSKHTSAGADEYVLETTSDYQKTIGNSDIKILYQFDVTAIPYLQIQTKATDVDTGGGTEGTITIDFIKTY